MAADQGGLEHRGGKWVFGQLRQEREPLRALAPRPCGEFAPVESHAAGRGRAKSGERMERERLADTVPAEHGDELAASRLELERAHERAPRHRDVDRAAFEPRCPVHAYGCRRS